jgi:hypothetical protein
MPDINQQLRDVILLEADWLCGQAAKLNLQAKRNVSAGSLTPTNFLNELATQCRDRARILHVALEATEPEKEAKAS